MKRLSDAAIERVAARYGRRSVTPAPFTVRRTEFDDPAALENRIAKAVGSRWTARKLIEGMRRQPDARAFRVDPVAGGMRGWAYTPITPSAKEAR